VAAGAGVSLRVLGLPSAGRWIRQEGDRVLLLDIAPFVTSTFSMEIKLYISLYDKKLHIYNTYNMNMTLISMY